jgi:ABC-type lipoprotein export system ATPase subunit
MPIGWKWIYWCSFISYAIKALMVNEMMPMTWSCNESESLIPGVINSCQFTDGHSALQLYDMDAPDEQYKWTLIGYVACFTVGWNLLALASICTWDWSNTDSAEPPNWEAGTKKVKVNDDDVDPALTAALKPEPAFIQWNNLSYTVVLPRSAAISAAASKKEAEAKAKLAASAAADGSQIEMVEVKVAKSKSNDDEEQIPDAPGTRTLLQDCYGYAKPGMMVALMGGSGAGKTTLLDVLAGKKTGGTIANGPLINGKPRDLSFNRIAGYVEQFDSHDETATVREAIAFSAMLRLPKEMTFEMKMAKVDTVIQTLRLGHVQHQQIGNAIRGGISPELRKKVTIGVELVMDPGKCFHCICPSWIE